MGTIQDRINALRLSIAAAQAEIDALAKQLCQVGGTLFNDTDADGRRDHGEGVTGVRKILLRPGDITATSDAAGNYTIANLDAGAYQITRPDFPAGYRLSNPTTPCGTTIAFTLAAGEHKTVDVGTTNRTAGVPAPIQITQIDAATSDDAPAFVWPAIGACITLTLDARDDPAAAATAARAKALGLTHLRSFGPACKNGGALDAGYANAVRRLTSRGLRVVLMHGAPEADPAHTTFADDDWKRYFDAVAVARNGNTLYEIELQNEFNLAHYWPLGGGAALNTAAIAKVISIATIARAALGPAATIIGPSIGWDADPSPHLLYQKALLDAGLLEAVTAINTHLYFANPQQTADVLGQYCAWAGPAAKIYTTETNCPVAAGSFATTALPFIRAICDAGVTPMIYRLGPRGDNAWDDRCLFTAAGAKNTPVTAAWLG